MEADAFVAETRLGEGLTRAIAACVVATGETFGLRFGDGDIDGDGDGDGDDVAADAFGEGELRAVGETVLRGDGREGGSNGVGEAAAIGVTEFGDTFGALVDPPKKCANTPPSNSPAKITITTSGNNGSPPPPPESSSVRRRRGESLT
jgi:hypothetical protein